MDYLAWLGGIVSVITIVGVLIALSKLLWRAFISRHTLPVSRAKSREIALAEYLEKQDMELSWHAVDTVDRDLQHRGYERIKWKDSSGKVWRLVNDPTGDFPLAKRNAAGRR